MEASDNIISSQAKLSAIAGIMFFSPLINNNTQSNPWFSDYEKDFIISYTRIWYINLALLWIVLVTEMIWIFLPSPLLDSIRRLWCIMIYAISLFSLSACVFDIPMRWKNESIVKHIQNKSEVLKAYIPGLNFSMWYRLPEYSKPYRWLKESILMRCIFIIWSLIFGPLCGIWILSFIVWRLVLLLLNIDIIPLWMKKALNSVFVCNPWESIAYLSSHIISKLKNRQYYDVLLAEKKKYYQWQTLWVNAVLQYILSFVVLWLLYRNVDISSHHVLIFVSFLLWIIRVVIFYINKKTILKVPFLSEIVSLIC